MNNRWTPVFLCAIASLFLSTVNVALSPILLIVKTDLNLTYTQSGMLTTAYFIGYTIGQIPWGYLTIKLKASKAIFLSVLSLVIVTFLSSMATTGDMLLIMRFFCGFLGAGIFVPGTLLVSGWFPTNNRGLAIGLFGMGTSMGGIVLSFVAPPIALSLGWRWSIRVPVFLGLATVLMIYFWLKDAPESEIDSRERESLKTVISSKAFWILGYDQFIRLGLSYATSAWLPTFLSENYGLDTVTASLSIALMNVVGIFSNPFGGLLSDRIGETLSTTIAFATMVPASYLLSANNDLTLVWIIIALTGFFLNFLRSPLFSILPKIYDVRNTGVITGYQNTFATIGAFFFPFLIGFLRDTTGSFTIGWISLAIFTVPALISTLTLIRYDKRQQ